MPCLCIFDGRLLAVGGALYAAALVADTAWEESRSRGSTAVHTTHLQQQGQGGTQRQLSMIECQHAVFEIINLMMMEAICKSRIFVGYTHFNDLQPERR